MPHGKYLRQAGGGAHIALRHMQRTPLILSRLFAGFAILTLAVLGATAIIDYAWLV